MRIRVRAAALLIALAPAVFAVEELRAQPANSDAFTDTARQRFQEGVKLFDQGRFEEARAAFLQAWALKQHPAVLLNLAQSELKSNHSAQAARHFSQYLRDYPKVDPNEKKAASDGLALARTKTARLEIRANVAGADVFIDDELVGRTPLPEPVDTPAGTRKVELKMPGYKPMVMTSNARLGRVEIVDVALRSESGAVAPPLPVAAAPAADSTPPDASASADAAPLTAPAARTPFFSWLRHDKVAWVSGGVTGVGVVMSVVFMIAKGSAASNADNIAGQIRVVAERDPGLDNYQSWNRHANPCAAPIPITASTNYGPACDQLQNNIDKSDTDRTLSYVGLGVIGAGAVATGVLYFVRTKPGSKPASTSLASTAVVAPIVAPGIQGLSFGGTF